MSKQARSARGGAAMPGVGITAVLVFGCAVSWLARASAGGDVARDVGLLQGTWSTVAKFNKDGKRRPVKDDDDDHFSFRFEKGDVTMISKELSFTAKYRLRPGANPKEMEIVRTLANGTVWQFRGIYDLQGDRMLVALGGPQDPPAKQFRRTSGVEFAVEMKRQK